MCRPPRAFYNRLNSKRTALYQVYIKFISSTLLYIKRTGDTLQARDLYADSNNQTAESQSGQNGQINMNSIVIVDLGTGNLRSVSKALTVVSSDAAVSVSAEPQVIESADYLVLPGQGAIGTWFEQLNSNEALKNAVKNRLDDGPVLGICLGLQALYGHSEEDGGIQGLGLLPGCVKHFASHSCHQQDPGNGAQSTITTADRLKIPHMGWNQVNKCNEHPLWYGIDNDERFYFVHSYYVESEIKNQVMGECQYGNRFTAAAASKNIFATQFHPEKSQHAGLQLLKNFINWNGSF